MALFKKKKKNRVFVLGLDGVPYSLLRDLAGRDIMPTVKGLIESGHLHKMKASLPEISAVSWTDFMTGSDSGTHGIFGFTDVKPDSYDMRFPNFLDLKTETFWDTLGKRKKRSIVINQPSTYPAREINGILVSGFVAIELAKAVFPSTFRSSLEKLDYQIDIDTMKSREDPEFLWKDLYRTLDKRINTLNLLWNQDWDYFEFVITGTDRLQHFLWNAYADTEHPHHKNFLDYYRQIDQVIAYVTKSFRKLNDSDEGLFLLSDHGFTGIEQEVYLNVWLEKQGYLQFDSSPPENLADISLASRAFAMDPNRIYLNLKDKFPKGSVDPSDKNAIKQEIADKMEKMEWNGKKVVRKVFDAQEVYEGPHASQGPDLIVLSEYGFDMKGSIKKKDIFGRTNLQGMHTWDDAFFWAHKDFGQDLAISNLSEILMDKLL
ncbi:MAG: alkaline phosphatase family protein [Candidatus Aminicenantes bacterium]|nr:MAG: alkaline phosphatase family protein [Candidatus Aminicenantes bacterium]